MAKSFYEVFDLDETLQTEGIFVDYGQMGKFKIARAGGANRKYLTRLEQLMRPHRAAAQVGALDEETAMKILVKCYAETVILGWEGIHDKTGELLSFSQANCEKLLNDLPELFRDLKEQAEKIANFTRVEVEEDAKD